MSSNIRIKHRYKRKFGAFIIIFLVGLGIGIPVGIMLGSSETADVTLTMIYSSEKRAWIESIVSEFVNWYSAKNGGETIAVNFRPMGSRSMCISTITGEIRPVILSPASSIWIYYLNNEWNRIFKTNLINISNSEENIRIIYSPFVIGTWEDFNNTYGITSFNDLRNVAVQSFNLRLSHTDPQLSNSGYMAVVMEVASFFKKNTSEIILNDLLNNSLRVWMHDIEGECEFYGKSTGFLAHRAMDQTLDVFMIYENLVININNGVSGRKAIAIYPRDGTLLADHPFTILKGSWVSKKQYEAAKQFLEFLQLNSTIKEAFQYGFRPYNPKILLNATYNSTFNSIFNYGNGLKRDLTIPLYNPAIQSDVFKYLPDLWLVTKAK
ncbi:MAG: substrate-binding domain-containing protein [Candidatus Helarchaeota archaeon]